MSQVGERAYPRSPYKTRRHMLFRSNYAAFRQVVRHEIKVPHPTLPTFIDTIKALRAEFGQIGEEYTYFNNLTGQQDVGAEVRGHYFDSVEAQEREGWTDEERVEVEEYLKKIAVRIPDYVQIVDLPAAPKPWPSYDSMDEKKVIEFAIDADLVEDALKYEVENQNRDLVIVKLRKALEAVPSEGEEELAVA